jgi:hypothetical protein
MTDKSLLVLALALTMFVTGCASGTKNLPYLAFVQADELGFAYVAELPGISARRLSGDLKSGRFSAILYLPANWRWTTGAAPGKSVEIYVIEGEITLADLALRPGNHAYLPPGSMGLSMSTTQGAQVLYFIDEASPNAVIQTPLFMSRDVVPWQSLSDAARGTGLETKELRSDPGSGARTYLLLVPPGASLPWQQSSVTMEGFLLSGDHRHSECVNGKPVTETYAPGGYFQRPAGAINGGPEAGSRGGAVWLMREPASGLTMTVETCEAP